MKMRSRRYAKDRRSLVMDRPVLKDGDHRVLELLDSFPGGLSIPQIDQSLGWDARDHIRHLLITGFIEKTRDGRFRTLGFHGQAG